jgi:hypothetical protein
MAKKSSIGIQNSTYKEKPKSRRPGIVAKTKASKNPNSKNYLKRYRGQGR